MIRILYFARLKDELELSEETLDYSPSLATISDLKSLLATRGERWQKAFKRTTLTAANQEVVNDSYCIEDNDEIAFFPPVTGG